MIGGRRAPSSFAVLASLRCPGRFIRSSFSVSGRSFCEPLPSSLCVVGYRLPCGFDVLVWIYLLVSIAVWAEAVKAYWWLPVFCPPDASGICSVLFCGGAVAPYDLVWEEKIGSRRARGRFGVPSFLCASLFSFSGILVQARGLKRRWWGNFNVQALSHIQTTTPSSSSAVLSFDITVFTLWEYLTLIDPCLGVMSFCT